MKIRLRTLSPLHIGTGEELTPLEYVVYQDRFYRIPQDRLFELTQNLMPKDGADALADWVTEQYDAMNNASDNRELARLNDQMNPYGFFSDPKQGKEREFVKALQHEPSIPVLVDERTRNRNRRAKTIPLGKVRGMIKNGQGQPYLPGSSLKGSLRTALLFHYLSKHADKAQVERTVRDQIGRRARKERFSLPLMHLAFFCGIEDVRKRKFKADDEKMDLLKLVRIPDARLVPTSPEAPSIQMAKINIYLVEKQQTRHRDDETTFEASQQPQAAYCEAIPQGRALDTELDFDIEFLLQIKPFIQKDGVPNGDTIQWVGIKQKVRQLFNLDLDELTASNKEAKKAEVLQHLMDCWTNFAHRQLAAQKAWLSHYKENDSRDRYSSRIANGMQPILSRTQKPIVRLGYATGFQGTTALLHFLEDAKMANLYKGLLESFNIGNKPGNRGAYKVNMDRFPKSRRMIEDDKVIRPLGWLEWIDEAEPIALADAPEATYAAVVSNAEPVATVPPAKPEPAFFTGKLNTKRPPELDAVVTASGRPNKVKVYVQPDYMPELDLNGYASPLEVGLVITVRSVVNKKGKVVQVSFGSRK